MDQLIASVRSERLKAGLSIRRLAVLTGVPFATLAHLESGAYAAPNDMTKAKLERWLAGAGVTRSLWEADIEHRLAFLEGAKGFPATPSSDTTEVLTSKEKTMATTKRSSKRAPVKAAAKRVASKLKGAKKGGKKGGKKAPKGAAKVAGY